MLSSRLSCAALLLLAALFVLPAWADWTQWGGAERDFAVPAGEKPLPWKTGLPATLWSVELGPGYSGTMVQGNRVVTMDRQGDEERFVAFDAGSGERLWEHRYQAVVPRGPQLDTSYGDGPASTPVIHDGAVCGLGFTGVVSCVDLESGAPRWSHDLRKAFNVAIPYFGHASSPLVHDGKLIVVAGGVLAFDPADGKLLWSNREFFGSYASPGLMERDGRTLLIVPAAGEIVGLDAADGALLWREEYANQHRTILASPVVGPGDWVVISAYFLGTIGLQISADGSEATRAWENPRFQLSYSNSIRSGKWLYGFHNSILAAVNIENGEFGFRHRGIERSNLLRRGDQALLLDATGKLLSARLQPDGVEVHGEGQLSASRSWVAPVLDDTTLYLRDENRLTAFDLRRKAGKSAAKVVAAKLTPELEAQIAALEAAIYRGDAPGIGEARDALEAMARKPEHQMLAGYYAGYAHWFSSQMASGGDRSSGGNALKHVDAAVELLQAAVKIDPSFGDARALLSRLYPMYYRLDPRRASVIGVLGDEHLSFALVHEPENPRVMAAEGFDLIHTPAQHGGNPTLGLKKLRIALDRFGKWDGRAGIAPGWLHASTWVGYGNALMRADPPRKDEAAEAFRKALELVPEYTSAKRGLAGATESANAD
ncbi:hypothetical protein ABI59_22165 [Acidobacteria bacterium Mor1]|nr:hypothetical protein ABI59_22165 [Acidobacteria bacterium Mor1]